MDSETPKIKRMKWELFLLFNLWIASCRFWNNGFRCLLYFCSTFNISSLKISILFVMPVENFISRVITWVLSFGYYSRFSIETFSQSCLGTKLMARKPLLRVNRHLWKQLAKEKWAIALSSSISRSDMRRGLSNINSWIYYMCQKAKCIVFYEIF